jgi:hypothetical protein
MSMREMMGCIILLIVIRTNNSEGNVRITRIDQDSSNVAGKHPAILEAISIKEHMDLSSLTNESDTQSGK